MDFKLLLFLNPSSVTGGGGGFACPPPPPFKDVKFPQKLFNRNARYESSVNKYYFKGYLGIFEYSCIDLNGLYRGFYSIYLPDEAATNEWSYLKFLIGNNLIQNV